jgi:hypothetical protein
MSTGRTVQGSVIPDSAAEPSSIARIRDAALTLFADHGIEAASLRTIAKAAGVSVGLVQHPSAPRPTSFTPLTTT